MIMDDFRKKMHVAYKNQLSLIILRCLNDISDSPKEFEENPILYVERWVDANCLPMGDFDKEKAVKEIEEWSK